jgi:hypothetical protein
MLDNSSYRHKYGNMKTTIVLPDELMTEVKVLAARERRKLGELMSELVQAGIQSRSRRKPGQDATRRNAAREWLRRWDKLSGELSAALPEGGGSIVEEMIRDRDRRC